MPPFLKGLLVPTLSVLVGLAILIGLGNWQMQRRSWKLDLIEQINIRSTKDPIGLQDAMTKWRNTKDIDHVRLKMRGVFDHSKERHLFTVEKGIAGWRIFTPLKTPRGYIAFIDRGFVPDALKDKSSRSDGLVEPEVTITGLARRPSIKGWFTLENDKTGNEFYFRSLDDMSRSVYSGTPAQLVPFFLEAQSQEPASGPWPKPGIPRLSVPNKHLEYALTWYGLGVVLIIIFGLFVRGRLNEQSA